MQECWINVYEWSGDTQSPKRKIVGLTPLFPTRIYAMIYMPSPGLIPVYRIHVKMKEIKSKYEPYRFLVEGN